MAVYRLVGPPIFCRATPPDGAAKPREAILSLRVGQRDNVRARVRVRGGFGLCGLLFDKSVSLQHDAANRVSRRVGPRGVDV